jgi:hypothetical protein
MAAIPFALSIHHFISSVGADAGFAAIIGLALLVLLFFAQARETANLRRRADAAESELQALQMYVQQLARTPAPAPTTSAPVAAPPAAARIAARPAAAPVASRAVVPEPAGALATIPAAPAGVGAPALSSATRLIPLADEISIRALNSSSNGHTDPVENGTATATVAAPAPATVPAGPPPSTAAGGGNGVPRVPPPPSAGITDDVPPPPRVALRPPGTPVSRPSFTPPPREPAGGRGGIGRGAIFVIAALVLALVIVGVFVLTNSSGGGASSSSSSSNTAASRTSTASSSTAKHGRHSKAATVAPVKVVPSTVTVGVLNGTATPLLAADIMTKLTKAGYKAGQTANAPPASQSLQSTIVGYTQPAYRNDALAVAKSLNLGTASVQGVNPADQTAACSQTPTNCPAQVVVTVGSDLASAG